MIYKMGLIRDIKILTGKDNLQTPVNAKPKKILIVEDEKLLGDALELKLKHAGFEVFRAVNGQIGLEVAHATNPDVILLDLLMPVMDGKTMLYRLRASPEFKTTPVIILTNAGDVNNIKENVDYNNA